MVVMERISSLQPSFSSHVQATLPCSDWRILSTRHGWTVKEAFRTNLRSYGCQQNLSRERRHALLVGLRRLGRCKDANFCLLKVRCDASDREQVSTAATSEGDDQQKSPSSIITNATTVEQTVGVSTGLTALDAYFKKLTGGSTGSSEIFNTSAAVTKSTVLSIKSVQEVVEQGSEVEGSLLENVSHGKEPKGLKALDAYFDKMKPTKPETEPMKEEAEDINSAKSVELSEEELFIKALMEAKEEYENYKSSQRSAEGNVELASKFSEEELNISQLEQEGQASTSSDFINLIVAVNVAVYLFGLASPHEAFGITGSSLPFVYGAKVNELIISGQWWRVVTPMFLHASFWHVALGSWALLSFGPAVESAYGTYGFALIYILGGLFGNVFSFFHTTDWTVGGTGPIYALVGTWLVYLLKNREEIGKEIADDMIRKVVLLSALNVALWNSLPVDDWTHLGAILIGVFFGILASPTMHLNLSLKEVDPDGEELGDAFLWLNEGLGPTKLTLVFVMCLGIFYVLYQLAITGIADFYLLQDTDVFS